MKLTKIPLTIICKWQLCQSSLLIICSPDTASGGSIIHLHICARLIFWTVSPIYCRSRNTTFTITDIDPEAEFFEPACEEISWLLLFNVNWHRKGSWHLQLKCRVEKHPGPNCVWFFGKLTYQSYPCSLPISVLYRESLFQTTYRKEFIVERPYL